MKNVPIAMALLCALFCAPDQISAQKSNSKDFELYDTAFTKHADVYALKFRDRIFRKDQLEFGPFQMTKSKKGWVKSKNSGVGVSKLNLAESRNAQKSNLILTDGSKTVAAELAYYSRRQNLNMGKLGTLSTKDEKELHVFLHLKGMRTVALHLKDDGSSLDKVYPEGAFEYGGKNIELRCVEHTVGKFISSRTGLGLELREGDRVLAVMEIAKKRRVMMAKGLDREKRMVLASAIAAVVYQYEILQ